MSLFSSFFKLLADLFGFSASQPARLRDDWRILIFADGAPELALALKSCLKVAKANFDLEHAGLEELEREADMASRRVSSRQDYGYLQLRGADERHRYADWVPDESPKDPAVEIAIVSAPDLRVWSGYPHCVIAVPPRFDGAGETSLEADQWLRSRLAQLTPVQAQPSPPEAAQVSLPWWKRIFRREAQLPQLPGAPSAASQKFVLSHGGGARWRRAPGGVEVGDAQALERFLTRAAGSVRVLAESQA
jgi:hypothetical protein